MASARYPDTEISLILLATHHTGRKLLSRAQIQTCAERATLRYLAAADRVLQVTIR